MSESNEQQPQHISKQQRLKDLFKDIEAMTNRGNVDIVLNLLEWSKEKIPLIEAAERKKAAAKAAKNDPSKPRPKILRISRGEVWEAKLGYNVGSEESLTRPVLVIQNDHNNRSSSNTIIAPITKVPNRFPGYADPLTAEQIVYIRSKLRPTEVLILSNLSGGKTNLKYSSILYCQNIRELSKERLTFLSGKMHSDLWPEVDNAIRYSLGM